MVQPGRGKMAISESQPEIDLVEENGSPPGSQDAYPRLVAQREHSLLSLMELGRELTVSMDRHEIVDLVLFNLMGQVGTSKAAMWIVPGEGTEKAVLLRSYGIRKHWAKAIGTVCGSTVAHRGFDGSSPTMASDLTSPLEPASRKVVEDAGVALFAPVLARGRLTGVVALGSKISGQPYDPVDLQVVETSLGMLGVALENNSLYNSLRENNRKLRSANEHLQELDNLKSEFLRNVNHELRTPLTIVIAYLDLVLHEEIDEDRKGEVLQTSLDQSEKLLGLLENLLDYSALSADSLTVSIETCDVAAILQDFYQERLPGIAEGLREFNLGIGDAIPQVRVDPLRLRQILNVIVDNAVKFTPQGARIVLRADRCDQDGDVWVKIDVDDDGPGIPEDRIPGLFESFRQLDGSQRRSVGGMGMGLALARDLAERIGSRLSVTSEVGKGSIFTLMIPGV
jgi:signal transduction histidine kinase